MAINANRKNEMDALYHTVKDMDDLDLQLLRRYAEHLKEAKVATNEQLLHEGNFLAPGSAFIH